MTRAPRDLEMTAFADAAAPADPMGLSRIRLRARRYVLWLQHVWAGTPGTLGLSISPEEVDRILTDGDDVARAEQVFFETDPSARMLTAAIADADAAAAGNPRLDRLRRALGLSEIEIDLLCVAVAVEADPWLRRVFGYIHDDATSLLPTPWLARQLFQWDSAARIGPESGLVRWHLARPAATQASPWSIAAAWIADPGAVNFLLDGRSLDPALGDAVRFVQPSRPAGDGCLYPDELETMVGFVRAFEGSSETSRASRLRSIEIVIAGPAGAGKRTLATELCAELQRPLLIADAGALSAPTIEPAAWRESLERAWFTAKDIPSNTPDVVRDHLEAVFW